MTSIFARHRVLRLVCVLLAIATSPALAREGASNYFKKPAEWYASSDAKDVADNILSYQSDLGGWPKNVDTTAMPYAGKREDLHPTFDNGATTDELRFLA